MYVKTISGLWSFKAMFANQKRDDLSSRSQLLIEAFEILNIYFASTFGPSPFQALTTKSLSFSLSLSIKESESGK